MKKDMYAMNQKGFSNAVLVIVLVALAGIVGYVAVVKNRQSALGTQPSATSPVGETAGWKTYRSEEHGFGFQYPEAWSAFQTVARDEFFPQESGDTLFFFEFEKQEYASVLPTLEILVMPGGAGSARAYIEGIQQVIDANYVTPPDASGAETCYTCESGRYTISNLRSAQGVQIYHYDYTGKYTVIESYFYFDTDKGKTVLIKAVNENEDFFRTQPQFRALLESITLN